MGVQVEDFALTLRQLFELTNIRGALANMPHKVATFDLVDNITPTTRIAGACNAIRKWPGGRLLGDQFHAAGFVRGMLRDCVDAMRARASDRQRGGVGGVSALRWHRALL